MSETHTGWRDLSGPLGAAAVGEGPRIVFVHGFTQTGNSMRPLAEHFAALGHESIVVDLPGHGGSGGVRADLRRTADLLTDVAGPATYVGYSLGGRACLHAALMYPHLVRALVLIGANPGIDDDDLRAERRADDDRLAAEIGEIGVAAFVDRWVAQPLFAGLELTSNDRDDRLRNTAEGLASSLFLAGTGAQGSLWRRLRELAMPVLFLAGALDGKFVDIGVQVAERVLRGTFVEIPECGHAAHLQRPAEVMEAIERWLPPAGA
jgi:2-succinyl-6-hydroxy-2,4-cyclohexadiene-1-carboxylate synthase